MSENLNEKLLLVTGGSGYVALNVIHELSKLPVHIRTTVRNVNDKIKTELVKKAAEGSKYPIEIVQADLLQPETWNDPCQGVDVVIHVASPFPSATPEDPENNLFRPAIEGTRNVLNAAFKAKVTRVVLTSSCAAIYDSTATNRVFTENDWKDPNQATPYQKSKILAERTAWDFVEEKKKCNEECFQLATINPCFVLGPTFGHPSSLGTSEKFISGLLQGQPEKVKEWVIGHCDVRDVALAHVRAAFLPDAAGHRHIIETKWASNKEPFEILKQKFTSYKLTTEFEPSENPNNKSDTTRMTNILGITPTDYEKTIVDMAESLINRGFVKT